MRTMEFTGRTVDEAIFHGLTEMGVTIDQVNIVTVQTESRGLFGLGARNAIVRLIERETPVIPDFEAINEERRAQKTESEGAGGKEKSRGFAQRKDTRREKAPARVNGTKEKRNYKEAASDCSVGEKDAEAACERPYSLEEAQNNDAAVFLQNLLGKMQLEGTVKACVNEEGTFLNMESSTDGLLIGHRGETLDALQYLTSLYANKNRKDGSYIRICVDTEGYRGRREQSLRRLARSKALRVARTGISVEMEPMNPYERRILHAALQDFRGVTTHSEGEEPNRRVVITPEA